MWQSDPLPGRVVETGRQSAAFGLALPKAPPFLEVMDLARAAGGLCGQRNPHCGNQEHDGQQARTQPHTQAPARCIRPPGPAPVRGGLEQDHCGAWQVTRLAPFSPIMIAAALVLPETSRGMTDASITLRPATPFTLSCGSSTAPSSIPIRHVPAG